MLSDACKVILIVDDCPEIRRMIGRLLGPAFECVEAASLEQATAQLATHDVDVVLLDLMLAGATLDETLAFARIAPVERVVTMSGLTPDALELAGLPVHAAHHVSKPFTFRELVAHM